MFACFTEFAIIDKRIDTWLACEYGETARHFNQSSIAALHRFRYGGSL